ncbi:MAG: single-stranded DNA-binding protein [Flavobacteriales bacterium]|jgi:single-strand DNA-binding protein|nr:single-stranded DNA-binding protein [Flavobacteriales bacterium]
MANSVNKVILIGRVGRDPEIKTLENGVKLGRFSLATTEIYKNKDGSKSEHTEWHQIIVWRGMANLADLIVEKGALFYVEGRIRSRSWEDPTTNDKKYSFEIVADELHLLSRSQKALENDNSTQYKESDESPL